jgi:hypothetical protein
LQQHRELKQVHGFEIWWPPKAFGHCKAIITKLGVNYWVKSHYSGQRLLSQILLFETMCVWTTPKIQNVLKKTFFAKNVSP